MHGNVMWLMVTVRRSAEGAAVGYGSPQRRRRGQKVARGERDAKRRALPLDQQG